MAELIPPTYPRCECHSCTQIRAQQAQGTLGGFVPWYVDKNYPGGFWYGGGPTTTAKEKEVNHGA